MNRMPRAFWFAAYAALVLLAGSPYWGRFIALGRSDDQYTHILAVPVVSLVLLWIDHKKIFAASPAGSRSAPVLVFALAVWILCRTAAERAAEPLAIGYIVAGTVVLLCAGVVALWGTATFRRARFPLLFLFLAIPIPPAVHDRIVHWLQLGSADASELLFGLISMPAFRDGLQFLLPGVVIEVAKECSGIRSSIGLLLAALLLGYLYLPRWWQKLALVAIVVPLAMLKNGVRIVTLTYLGIYQDPSYLRGNLHSQGGVVFFLGALLLLFAFMWLLSRAGRTSPASANPIAATQS